MIEGLLVYMFMNRVLTEEESDGGTKKQRESLKGEVVVVKRR